MTTNPDATRILCFGDSNTWGQKAHEAGRYPVTTRWTGRLQKLLGDDIEIIEEGLSSRTTDLNYNRKPGRNGRAYLTPCLASHNPLDAVIIMLGTNDAKIEFGPRSAQEIALALEGLGSDVIRYGKNSVDTSPDVILVCPPYIDSSTPAFREMYRDQYYNDASVAVMRELAPQLKQVADRNHWYFVDAAEVTHAGDDGIHMNEESHHALANLLANKLSEWVL